MANKQKGRKLRRALATLIALIMCVGGAGYTTIKNGKKLQMTQEVAYVHADDDEDSALLLTLSRGDEFKLLEVDDKWCKVEMDDVVGYVLVEQLDIDVDEILANAEPTQAPTEAPTAEPTEQPTAEPTAIPTEAPTAEPTAIPTEEPADSLVGEVSGLEDGDETQPADEAQPTDEPQSTDEAQPTDEPQSTDEAQPTDEPQPTEGAQPTDEPQPTEGAQPTDEPQPTDEAQPTGEPTVEPTALPEGDATAEPSAEPSAMPEDDGPDADEIDEAYDAEHPTGRTGYVNVSWLNMRSAPAANAPIVTQLEQGTEVSILEDVDGYLRVRIARGEGVEGYVVAEYVSETVAVEQTASVAIWGSAVIDASSLNVRSTASTSGKLLYKVSRNERVLLRSRSGDWYGIETEDGSGFVLGDYLEVYEVPSGTYKQGNKGDAVKEIQRRLIELGHMTGSADGSFGAATKNAVMAFQRSVGLSADGVVGTGTLNKLFSLNSSGSSSDSSVTYETLEYGDSGDAVKSLQNRLIELGYLATSATGNFGSATKSALIEFQKKAGLTADGVAGQTTQQALYAEDAPSKNAIDSSSTLKLGDKGDAVTELQKRLIELGYLTTSATGTFGEATKAAVTEFQKMAGLSADGVAGQATINALFATDAPLKVDTTTLKQGDKGDSVKALQNRLIELGYLTGSADGVFGAGTTTAVKEFQKAAGITADGVAGASTITAMFSASAPRKPDGTLKRGDRGDAVVDLQNRLRKLGYLTDTADGIFGDTTEAAVKEFQKAVGLTADGVVGQTTLDKLNASDAPEKEGAILRQGSTGNAVKGLQQRLIELGYLSGSADGIFGSGTKSALMQFQAAAGLEATGVADIDTQEALEATDAPELSGSTLQQGSTGEAVKKLQQRLIELRYLTGSADGTYGSATKAAVQAFQQVVGLEADGVADPTTQMALYASDAPAADSEDATTLEVGSRGEAVKKLQQRLIELGYLNGSADGDFGSATKAAVKLFQKQVGITVDGVAGQATQAALYASDAPKYDGETSVDTDASSTAEKIIATAKQYLGCPYVYGTSGPNTFDCSGFTSFVFKKYGYSLLRSAQQQGYDDSFTKLTRSQLRMGDLVFFNTVSDSDLSDHAGIYISDGNFIHASSGGGEVMISNLDSGYYNRVFSWGRRVLE